jgi:hypothetical protein
VPYGARLRQVVSELDSCLYISGRKRQEEVKSTLIHVKWYQSTERFFDFCSKEKRIHHAAEKR